MSLNTAKVTKLGILLTNSQKSSLIVPLKITRDTTPKESSSKMNLNRPLFLLLAENLSRYSIIYNKTSKTDFELLLICYFTSSQQVNLAQNTQNTLKRLGLLLSDNDFHIEIFSPQDFLNQVKNRVPKSIVEAAPQIYKIVTTKGIFYQSTAKFLINHFFEKKAFFSFLTDFLAILPKGWISIDIKNSQKRIKDKMQYISELAITVNLSDPDFASLQLEQKQLLSLLQFFSKAYTDEPEGLITLVKINEFQQNYGKIIFGQGWKFFPTDYESILDFSSLLELLPLANTSKK
ncbi:MAG: hypothetical protein ACTSQK_00315 [Candidatus Heimdallarchaeota archaeon]